MKKSAGVSFLLVLLVITGSAFAGDPFIEDIMGNGVLITFSILINLAVMTFLITAQWKLFVKAGEEGWIALIPIYNAVTMMKIAGKPGWWVVLLFVPFANLVVAILMNIGLARNFGRSDGFAIGLVFLPYIFLPVLGFGDSKYSQVVPTA